MMTKQNAYKMVYNDILKRDIGLFLGRFDAKNGDIKVMYGISLVMDFITNEASNSDYEEFQKIWCKNIRESLDKTKKE